MKPTGRLSALGAEATRSTSLVSRCHLDVRPERPLPGFARARSPGCGLTRPIRPRKIRPPPGEPSDIHHRLLDMRLLTTLLVVALLLVPAAASGGKPADARVSIFFYPWYGNAGAGRRVPALAARAGRTRRADRLLVLPVARRSTRAATRACSRAQMRRSARRASTRSSRRGGAGARPRTTACRPSSRAARAQRLDVAVHLEPYDGRTLESTARRTSSTCGSSGSRTSTSTSAHDVLRRRTGAASLAHLAGVRVFAQTSLVGFAAAGGFDGIYTYDILTYGGQRFGRLCDQAHGRASLCAPSVGPGYDARRALAATTGSSRAGTARRTTRMWTAAIRAERRPRHDHELQRVARGHADRAGARLGALRELRGRVRAEGARPRSARTSIARRLGEAVRAPPAA